MSSGKWRPFCLGLNLLSICIPLRTSSLDTIKSNLKKCDLFLNSVIFSSIFITSDLSIFLEPNSLLLWFIYFSSGIFSSLFILFSLFFSCLKSAQYFLGFDFSSISRLSIFCLYLLVHVFFLPLFLVYMISWYHPLLSEWH